MQSNNPEVQKQVDWLREQGYSVSAYSGDKSWFSLSKPIDCPRTGEQVSAIHATVHEKFFELTVVCGMFLCKTGELSPLNKNIAGFERQATKIALGYSRDGDGVLGL